MSVQQIQLERTTRMRQITFSLGAFAVLAIATSFVALAFGQGGESTAPIFVKEVPPGYREWKLISVAHEEGSLNDVMGDRGRLARTGRRPADQNERAG
jgi:hypothetical protein